MIVNIDSGSEAFDNSSPGSDAESANLLSEFQPDIARTSLAGIIPEESLLLMTDEQLMRAVDTLANLTWQRAVTLPNLATYVESNQKIIYGHNPAEVAAGLGMSLEEFEKWNEVVLSRVSPLIEAEELFDKEAIRQSPKLELVAPDIGETALKSVEISNVDEAPQTETLSDTHPEFNPTLVRNFMVKTFSKAEIDGLSDDELLEAIERLKKITKENPEHFQTGYKVPAVALHTDRLILKFQGLKVAKIAEQQQASITSVNNSYGKLSRLVEDHLPLGVLLGTKEFEPKSPKLISRELRNVENSGPQYSTQAVGAEIDSWRQLASQGESVPPAYEGLFNSHEMRMLTVISRGVKPRYMSKVMVLTPDTYNSYRSILLKKFGLKPKSSEVPKMVYQAVVNKLVPIEMEFDPPSIKLTKEERLIFILKARGLSDAQICREPEIKKQGLGLTQVRASLDSSTKKLNPGDGLPYGEALLAVGHGLIPYQPQAVTDRFIAKLRRIADDNGGAFERERPLTLQEQTIGVLVPETDQDGNLIFRNGKNFMVRKLRDPVEEAKKRLEAQVPLETVNSDDINPDQSSEIEELPAGF